MRYLVLLLLLPFAAISQELPDEWEYLLEEHQLNLGKTTTEGFYAIDEFQDIHITFSESNWQSLLDNYYTSGESLQATVSINGEVFSNVGVQYKGQTSYLMLPPDAEKMSFSIKLDEFIQGQDIDGYNNLNLNNAFQDPTFLREFLYLQLIRNHIPAAKANFARLYINGEFWGPYVNVQQINKDFLEEWFMSNNGSNWRADNGETPGGPGGGGPGGGGPNWGDGTAAMNYLGDAPELYQEYYTLKSTEQADPWSLLVNTCDVLNNTPLENLVEMLPAVLDVDRTLWFLACEMAFADDDGYVYKGKMDYYVYWEEETGRMTPQEFDGNSVLGQQTQNQGPFHNADDENYPLLHRLLQVPEYRQRYLAHLRTIIEELLDAEVTGNLIETFSDFIDAEVESDPKALYPYFVFLNEVQVLHSRIATRRNTLLANEEVNVEGASISNVSVLAEGGAWQVGASEEPIVSANIESPDGLVEVWLYYSNAQVGNFNRVPMFDEGATFVAQMPAIDVSGIMRFYIEAVEADEAETRSYLPVGAEHDVFYYIVAPEWVESDLVINEIMASNDFTVFDEVGEYEDWIELYNKGSEPIDISGYYLSDNAFNLNKWSIPEGTILSPEEYLIVWADEEEEDGTYHSNFKLSADGEQLTLLTADFKIADQTNFNQQQTDMGWARLPNGIGDFVIQAPTFAENNENSTGIEGAFEALDFIVYPNPASDVLYVKLSSELTMGNTLVVQDLSGRIVRTQQLLPGATSLDVEVDNLSAGMYLIHLALHDRRTTKRFVKK